MHFLLLIAFGLSACSSFLPAPQAPSLVQDGFRLTEANRPGQIVHLKSGRLVSFSQLQQELSKARFIFVGEVHDDPEHHLIQTQILLALLGATAHVHVGVEYLDATSQKAADDFVAERISEDVFLSRGNWEKNWGYSFYLYRPIFQAARGKAEGLVALNAPRRIVSKVGRSGIKSLNEEERRMIASDIDLGNDRHRRYLEKVFNRHPSFHPGRFDFFYEAQCVWEDTMAERAANYIKEKQGLMIIFCGNGHIAHRFGIPERLRRRAGAEILTVFPFRMSGGATIPPDLCDYVWLTGGKEISRTSPSSR